MTFKDAKQGNGFPICKTRGFPIVRDIVPSRNGVGYGVLNPAENVS